ncbi:MAG: hypothetical protein Q4D82_01065 [Neisseria sp.]|nr:hypothetical protein [Neisseria sp.]
MKPNKFAVFVLLWAGLSAYGLCRNDSAAPPFGAIDTLLVSAFALCFVQTWLLRKALSTAQKSIPQPILPVAVTLGAAACFACRTVWLHYPANISWLSFLSATLLGSLAAEILFSAAQKTQRAK